MLAAYIFRAGNAEPFKMTESTDTHSRSITSVLVSRPGIMRQSLQALLADCRGIDLAAVSGDGLSALSKIRKLRPGLVIIDSNLLEEETTALITAVKTEQPDARCLVFVQSAQQGSRLLLNGADAAALRESPVMLLQSMIEHLSRIQDQPSETIE
jgi:DNA-binding NarL/FixJ family response regulator